MPKGRTVPAPPETVISIIGPGLRVKGDCETSDTIRIEGVVEGSVTAKKAVVIGKEGRVTGDITTADARIAGTVKGTLNVRSRLELAATCIIDGEIRAARLQLDEGGTVAGALHVGTQKAEPKERERSKGPAMAKSEPTPQPGSAGRRLACG